MLGLTCRISFAGKIRGTGRLQPGQDPARERCCSGLLYLADRATFIFREAFFESV